MAAEDSALRNRDAVALAEFDRSLPQTWRGTHAGRMGSFFDALSRARVTSALAPDGLLSGVYAGTYFGLRQAVELEAVIGVAHRLASVKQLDSWQRDAILTTALHAASAASYSPGKHFAQPHSLSGDKDLTFHHGRLLSDRSIPVLGMVDGAAKALDGLRVALDSGHTVHEADVAEVSHVWRELSVVYADPPYTAQQYSRFYHVLDVMADGHAPHLQSGRSGARVTRGLYPEGRYLSDYCSSRRAARALRGFVEAVHEAQCSFILSYSRSRTGVTGNARMIEYGTLVDIVSDVYGRRNTATADLDLQYRPFNATAVEGAVDSEILVVGSVT